MTKLFKGRKSKLATILSLVLCASILFCGNVFADDNSTSNETLPNDMIVTATLTDEFNNVTNVDVEYTVTEVPNRSRAAGVTSYILTATTSDSNSDTGSNDGVNASLTIHYDKNDTWMPGDAHYLINRVTGYWVANGHSLVNRTVMAAAMGHKPTWNPTWDTFGYMTGFTEFLPHEQTYATSSVTINNGTTLSLYVRGKY